MSDPVSDVLNTANEGRIRVVDTWTNASDLVCLDVDKAYKLLMHAVARPKWLTYFGINTVVEIDCINETRQLVKVVMRPADIRLVFKFPMPSAIVKAKVVTPPPSKLAIS